MRRLSLLFLACEMIGHCLSHWLIYGDEISRDGQSRITEGNQMLVAVTIDKSKVCLEDCDLKMFGKEGCSQIRK